MGAKLRASAALSAGAFGLHQLRFLLAPGGAAPEPMGGAGHGYLALAGPVVAFLCAVALAQLAGAWRCRDEPGGRAPLRLLWAVAALALLLIYLTQESLEGLFTPGGELLAPVAGGGWVALPLAIVIGLLVALLLRGADALLAARCASPARFAPPRNTRLPAARRKPALSAGLACHLASRAPPGLS